MVHAFLFFYEYYIIRNWHGWILIIVHYVVTNQPTILPCPQDMEYWGVDDLYLEPCCVQRYYQQRELLNWDHQVKKEEDTDYFRPGRLGKLQKILWDLFEKPHTSVGARVS